MEYIVKRPHQGDQWYAEGDTRILSEKEAEHLVERGVLVKAQAVPKNKAAEVPLNK